MKVPGGDSLTTKGLPLTHSPNCINSCVGSHSFEICVVLEGNQTECHMRRRHVLFESCVVLEGNQTSAFSCCIAAMFENCVVLDGNQTNTRPARTTSGVESCIALDDNQTCFMEDVFRRKKDAKSALAKAQTTRDKRSRKSVLDMSLPWAGKL